MNRENELLLLDTGKRETLIEKLHKQFPKDAPSANYKHYILYKGTAPESGDLLCRETLFEKGDYVFYPAVTKDIVNASNYVFIIVRKSKVIAPDGGWQTHLGTDSVLREVVNDHTRKIVFKCKNFNKCFYIVHSRINLPIISVATAERTVSKRQDNGNLHTGLETTKLLSFYQYLIDILRDDDKAIITYDKKVYTINGYALKTTIQRDITDRSLTAVGCLALTDLEQFEEVPF